jgi:chromosome segregation ATPase
MELQIFKLNKDVEVSKEEKAELLESLARANVKLQEREKEIADLRADLEDAETYGKAKREEQKSLESRIADLERERSIREPLFQVGVSIRVRYLEMAKKLVMRSARGDLDIDSIKRGNAAAHSAMGEVDAVLFHRNILSNRAKISITSPFAELYGCNSRDCSSLSSKMIQVINSEATIRTLNVLNGGNRPLTQRLQVFEQIQILKNKYAKLSKEIFDTDEDVKWRVSRVVALTEEIVEEDRQSRADRQTHGKRKRGKTSILRSYIYLDY